MHLCHTVFKANVELSSFKFVRVFKLRYDFMATRERINEYVYLSQNILRQVLGFFVKKGLQTN